MDARHALRTAGKWGRRAAQLAGWVGLWLIITLVIGYIFAGPTDRLLLLWPISLAALWFWHRAEVASIRRTHASILSGWQAASELKDQHMAWLRERWEYQSERTTEAHASARQERLKVSKILALIHDNWMDEVRSSWSPDLGRSGKDLGRYLYARAARIDAGEPAVTDGADDTVAVVTEPTEAVAVPEAVPAGE
jgi:hypothetical protein